MNGTRTVLRQCGKVSCRAVAFVPGKTINRKSLIIFQHQPVAGDFGDNARRGDGKTARVAFDQCALRKPQRLHPQTVPTNTKGVALGAPLLCPVVLIPGTRTWGDIKELNHNVGVDSVFEQVRTK